MQCPQHRLQTERGQRPHPGHQVGERADGHERQAEGAELGERQQRAEPEERDLHDAGGDEEVTEEAEPAAAVGRDPRAGRPRSFITACRMRRTGARYAPRTPIRGIWYQARST